MRIEKLFQALKDRITKTHIDQDFLLTLRYIDVLDQLKQAHRNFQILEWAGKMALSKYHAGEAVSFKPKAVIRYGRVLPLKQEAYPPSQAKEWLEKHDPQTALLHSREIASGLEKAAMTTTDRDWRTVLADLRVRLALAYDAKHYAKAEAELELGQYA